MKFSGIFRIENAGISSIKKCENHFC